jgi:hypothetical protein
VPRVASECLVWPLRASPIASSGRYALVGLAPTAEQLGVFLTIVALVTLCAESIVVLVGAAMPDERSAAVVGPVVLALFMVRAPVSS